MQKLYELKDILMDSLGEFDTIKSGKLKMGEIEALNNITDTIKNIDKICMLEESDGYSQDGEWAAEMRGNYGKSYDERSRMNRGGNRDGEYSERGGNRRGTHYVRGHYSRDGSKDKMMRELEEAEAAAPTDRDRRILRDAMEKLENE